MLGESEVLCGFLTAWGSEPLTPRCSRVSCPFLSLLVPSALFLPSLKIQLLPLAPTPRINSCRFSCAHTGPIQEHRCPAYSPPHLQCPVLVLSDTHLCGHVLYLVTTATCKTPRHQLRHLISSLHILPNHAHLTHHSG